MSLRGLKEDKSLLTWLRLTIYQRAYLLPSCIVSGLKQAIILARVSSRLKYFVSTARCTMLLSDTARVLSHYMTGCVEVSTSGQNTSMRKGKEMFCCRKCLLRDLLKKCGLPYSSVNLQI